MDEVSEDSFSFSQFDPFKGGRFQIEAPTEKWNWKSDTVLKLSNTGMISQVG